MFFAGPRGDRSPHFYHPALGMDLNLESLSFVRALLGTRVVAGQVKNMQVEAVDYRKSSMQGGSTVSMSRIAETAAGPVYARTRSPVPARFASFDLER